MEGYYAELTRLLAAMELGICRAADARWIKILQAGKKVEESLHFMSTSTGIDLGGPELSSVDFYTAHECLLLPYYDETLTRED